MLIVTVRSKTSVPLIVAERQTDNTNCWMAAPPLFDVDTDTAKFLVLGEEMEVTVGVAGAVAIGAGPNVNVTGELDALGNRYLLPWLRSQSNLPLQMH